MALSPKLESYFRAQAALIGERSFWNCLEAAETVAALLLQEGRSPWIGRVHKSKGKADQVFHAPLIPLRSRGIVWTSHYVCVERGIVYDPAGWRPLPLRRYSQSVFGEELPIETFVARGDVEKYLQTRALRRSS